jgi:hypothetical protein
VSFLGWCLRCDATFATLDEWHSHDDEACLQRPPSVVVIRPPQLWPSEAHPRIRGAGRGRR